MRDPRICRQLCYEARRVRVVVVVEIVVIVDEESEAISLVVEIL